MHSIGKKELNDFCEYTLLIVANVLGKNVQDFSLDSPISQFGLDSIGVTKIVSIMNSAFKLTISPVNLYGHKTVRDAASNLYHRFKDQIDLSDVTSQSIQMYCDKVSSESPIDNQEKIIFQGNKVNAEPVSEDSRGLIEILFNRAQQEPNVVAYTLLDAEANQVDQITYANLHKHSLLIAKIIQDNNSNSKKVLLCFDKNINFIYGLFGTFYSGSIGIPFVAPSHFEKNPHLDNLIEIIKESRSDIIFTTRNIFSQLSPIISKKITSHKIKFIIYEDIDFANNQNIDLKKINNNPLALIQYSTGLSGKPKGVLYHHADLIKHLKRIQTSYQLRKENRSLSWIPIQHYMGLFYGILQPLFSGLSAYIFVETNLKFKPQRWLAAISKYRITFTGGPEFAYALCDDLTDMSLEQLDLSSWKIAYIGAEILNREVIERFIHKFQKNGLSIKSIYPNYGMAEAPLISTASFAYDHNESEITFSGNTVDGLNIQIVDPLKKIECKEGEIGEIWFSDIGDESYISKEGDAYSIYSEYQKNIGIPFVRTGDIGFKKNEKLYVCGKLIDFKPSDNRQLAVKEQHEPIAVVGMAGLFPQSDSCEEFWNNLVAGKDLISEIPENRWNWQAIYGHPDNENQVTDIKWGGFINDIEAFDASFFNISAKEAQLMDPMQRKLLQVVWQAVEDAGYRMSDLSGKKVGVFVGIGTFDYLQLILENNKFTHAYASTGIVHCMASNRISYLFDFKGPSESVDTACSSSLVALHRAVGLIRNNECEMAIVGGANILLSSSVYVALSNAGMLSKSGKCRTFDDAADGYVRGEGIAAIVLKKLNDAKLNNDHIYGLIKGAAVNHGGHTSSLTAPNPFSQAEVIGASLKDAGIDSSTLSYMETHGTATALGDPIEISGLTAAFATSGQGSNINKLQYCALGSVKTNIGHLEAAAGIASVIKVLLSMHHKKIPAHLHFKVSNKNINFAETAFYLNTDTTDWKPIKSEAGEVIPRRAGVSSFGFGGVNSHVTLEEYQQIHREDKNHFVKNVFLFSAKTETALSHYISAYCHYLKENAPTIHLNNMAYTLQIGRESFNYRLAIIASNAEELLRKLSNLDMNHLGASVSQIEKIYYAKIQNHYSNSSIFAANNKNIEEAAQRWILGETIDWKNIYINQSVNRISLPTYPFEKTYHWITSTHKKLSLINDTYDIKWYAEPLLNVKSNEDAEYIIFCDRQGVSERLNKSLGEKNIKVHEIYYTGDELDIENHYRINPIDKNDYIGILTKIAESSKNKIFNVLNLWPLDFGLSADPSLDVLSKDYQFLCQTALYQVQALNCINKKVKAHLWMVCANAQAIQNNKINLPAAPLWGMARTLVLEQPNLFRSIIDVDENINSENLLKEIDSFSKESEVVYRQNIRYVPRMEPCEVEQKNALTLNRNGAYLITGGLGSLGLLVGEWLSSLKINKLYLLSRNIEKSKHSSMIKDAIKRIQSNGTKVEILQGDVTHFEQMKSVAAIHFKQNELKGIFHLAGSYQESLLENIQFDDFKHDVTAKVEGTWVLHEIFKNYSLDCFILFSSGASVWGAATGGPYSAGNYFLDAYADYCKANHLPALSISWGGLWQSSGIIPKNKEEYFKSIGVKETSQKEGLQQLASIIDQKCHKKIVAPIEWPLFLEVMNAQREKSLFNNIRVREVRLNDNVIENKFIENLRRLSSRDEKYSLIINALKNLIKEALSISDDINLEEDTGFFNLGMDSLASIDFKNKINKTLGVEITTTTLFDCNTLRSLGNFLLTNFYKVEDDHHDTDQDKNTNELSELNKFNKSELLKFLESELENN